MTASMCGHFGTPYLYKELKGRSIQRMESVITLGGVILFTLYIPIMLCGYFSFTSGVHSNLLKTIAEKAVHGWYLQVANIAMMILIILHFPLTCYGCRAAVESMVFKNKRTPTWGLVVISFCIVSVLVLFALFVKDFVDVMDVTSSIAGSFVIIIIPACF